MDRFFETRSPRRWIWDIGVLPQSFTTNDLALHALDTISGLRWKICPLCLLFGKILHKISAHSQVASPIRRAREDQG